MSIVIAVVAAPVLEILAGVEYRSAASIVVVLAVFNATRAIDRCLGVVLDAIGKPSINAVKVSLSLVANLGLTAIALTYAGPARLEAAAAASVVAVTLGVVGTELWLWTNYRRSLLLAFPAQTLWMLRRGRELAARLSSPGGR
jgi:O-antigen/teichoic acid export membrane protein